MADGIPYTIHGKKVFFPCKAYPTQLSMMDRIMKGLESGKNCLLESPTGSGKSLALLCSCLAWQCAEHEKAKQQKEQKNSNDSPSCDTSMCKTSPSPVKPAINPSPAKAATSPYFVDLTSSPTTPKPINLVKTEEPSKSFTEEEEEDFKSDNKRFRTPLGSKSFNNGIDANYSESKLNNSASDPNAAVSPPEWKMEIKSEKAVNSPCDGDVKKKDNMNAPISVPKIYFGTRTHKQVSQIARELGKTAYKHTRMCILSSREHTCIHPKVSKGPNKNEECKKLRDPHLKGEMCFYYERQSSKMGSQAAIKNQGLSTAWDIEDFVRLGRKNRSCPYYAARELMGEADIIFCPYNYLIDPKIRSQMQIDLEDQIVVLDEAHNIEDSARESASLSIDTLELQDTLDDLDKMIQWGVMVTEYSSLHVMCATVKHWIVKCSEGQMKDTGFEQAVLVLSGDDIFSGLKEAGLTSASLPLYKKAFDDIMAADRDPDNDYLQTAPTSKTVSMLEGLFLVLGYLFGFEGKFVTDYRVTILKTAVFVRNEAAAAWKRAGIRTRKEWKYSLNIWCFNPAVVFSQLGEAAHSIILTSGTLSPMSSFASELGVDFPIKLEANHVIANSQVWVGSLAVGPSSSPINATFRFAETFSFQDDIGSIVLDVCQKIPHGVLCFFPSYNMLEKVSKRWQSTGLWSKLLQKKLVVSEPRSGMKSDFDDVMHEFYQAIRRSEGEEDLDCTDSDDEDNYGGEGALFLAVCRGKVSEGLDFADNNARAVITVGIPFPNTKDLKIDLKRKYNDSYASKRGLLNGSEWYEIQAFRALNQALGRCIRHKQDWGAILLVDERFSKSTRYSNGISKWVRQRLQHYRDFKQAVNSLKNFADARQLDPCPGTKTTPRPSSTGDSTSTKENAGLANNGVCSTPLTCKSDVSGCSAINQASSPAVLTNRFANNTMSTPVTGNTSHQTITTPITPQNPISTQISFRHPVGQTPVMQFIPQDALNQAIPNVTTQNIVSPNFISCNVVSPSNQQTVQVPMVNMAGASRPIVYLPPQTGPNVTQAAPRLIFLPNNANNVCQASPMNPCALRPATPSTGTRSQQVLYLTPITLNNQSNNQSSPANSTKKVIMFTTPNNNLNGLQNPTTAVNHVTTGDRGCHVNGAVNNVPSEKNGNQLSTVQNVTSQVSSASSQIKPKCDSGTIGTKTFVYPNGHSDQNTIATEVSSVSQPAQSSNSKPEVIQSEVVKKEVNDIKEEKEKKEDDESLGETNETQLVSDVDMLEVESPNSPVLFSTPPTGDSLEQSDEQHGKTESNPHTVDEAISTSKAVKKKANDSTLTNQTLSKKMCVENSTHTTDQEHCTDETKPMQKNLRRTTRPTSKGETFSKQISTSEYNPPSEILRCKQCNSVLYEGQVTQKTISCQELSALFDKFCGPKPRLSKKRKRGDSCVINREVWTTIDIDVIPDTVQILKTLQGEVFNALYKDDTVYIPIECRQCRGKTAVIGVQVLKQATKQMLFFNETVC